MAKTPAPTSTDTEGLTTGLPADEYKREQDKSGKDPISPAVEAKKAETVNIAPNEPYPTGGAKAEQGKPHNEVKPEE
jgi:hypothetical protein